MIDCDTDRNVVAIDMSLIALHGEPWTSPSITHCFGASADAIWKDSDSSKAPIHRIISMLKEFHHQC